MTENKENKTKHTYKDGIFRSLFNDEKELLTIYNALSGKEYPKDTEVEIVTLEDVIFNNQKNDIACVIDNRFISLIEHQSVMSPNIPLRMLSYIAKEYQKLYFSSSIYSETKVKIPTPEFYVFYNGPKDAPLEQELKLSDAYLGECDTTYLELIVPVININLEKGAEILEKCQTLKDYSTFISMVREKDRMYNNRDRAIEEAVEECIKNDIIADYLKDHRGEVMDFLHIQLSQEEREAIREHDGYVRGEVDGFNKGKAEENRRLSLEHAQKMKSMGMTFEQIQEVTGLDVKVIEKL